VEQVRQLIDWTVAFPGSLKADGHGVVYSNSLIEQILDLRALQKALQVIRNVDSAGYDDVYRRP
jgi:hypothetical protein